MSAKLRVPSLLFMFKVSRVTVVRQAAKSYVQVYAPRLVFICSSSFVILHVKNIMEAKYILKK